jgi:hypothetical protein
MQRQEIWLILAVLATLHICGGVRSKFFAIGTRACSIRFCPGDQNWGGENRRSLKVEKGALAESQVEDWDKVFPKGLGESFGLNTAQYVKCCR